jgi:hypothetical protein
MPIKKYGHMKVQVEKKSWTHEGPRKKKKENKEKISLSIEELK